MKSLPLVGIFLFRVGFYNSWRMGTMSFGRICFILAIIFTASVMKGIVAAEEHGIVLIVPALIAITLIVVGVSNFKKAA
jgi:hypothetical protein